MDEKTNVFNGLEWNLVPFGLKPPTDAMGGLLLSYRPHPLTSKVSDLEPGWFAQESGFTREIEAGVKWNFDGDLYEILATDPVNYRKTGRYGGLGLMVHYPQIEYVVIDAGPFGTHYAEGEDVPKWAFLSFAHRGADFNRCPRFTTQDYRDECEMYMDLVLAGGDLIHPLWYARQDHAEFWCDQAAEAYIYAKSQRDDVDGVPEAAMRWVKRLQIAVATEAVQDEDESGPEETTYIGRF